MVLLAAQIVFASLLSQPIFDKDSIYGGKTRFPRSTKSFTISTSDPIVYKIDSIKIIPEFWVKYFGGSSPLFGMYFYYHGGLVNCTERVITKYSSFPLYSNCNLSLDLNNIFTVDSLTIDASYGILASKSSASNPILYGDSIVVPLKFVLRNLSTNNIYSDTVQVRGLWVYNPLKTLKGNFGKFITEEKIYLSNGKIIKKSGLTTRSNRVIFARHGVCCSSR